MLYEKIKIGGKEVALCCCASVIPCYKNVFDEDFLKNVTKAPDDMDLYMRMGFIMAKFAETNDRAAVCRLTENDFYDWLDQFSSGDIINAVENIATIFMKESGGTVKAKKN